jgi:hypothetical protein
MDRDSPFSPKTNVSIWAPLRLKISYNKPNWSSVFAASVMLRTQRSAGAIVCDLIDALAAIISISTLIFAPSAALLVANTGTAAIPNVCYARCLS